MIDDVMQKICAAAADAVYRYAETSGEGPWDMPEYLMPATALHQLGSGITMTLETSFTELSEWNAWARKRHGMVELPEEKTLLAALALEIGSPRVDMVVFDGGNEVPKPNQDFLALIEWKRNEPSMWDREKLLKILRYVDTCPFGATAGCVRAGHAAPMKAMAEQDGDRWYQADVHPLPHGLDKWPHAVCARVFDRSARPRS